MAKNQAITHLKKYIASQNWSMRVAAERLGLKGDNAHSRLVHLLNSGKVISADVLASIASTNPTLAFELINLQRDEALSSLGLDTLDSGHIPAASARIDPVAIGRADPNGRIESIVAFLRETISSFRNRPPLINTTKANYEIIVDNFDLYIPAGRTLSFSELGAGLAETIEKICEISTRERTPIVDLDRNDSVSIQEIISARNADLALLDAGASLIRTYMVKERQDMSFETDCPKSTKLIKEICDQPNQIDSIIVYEITIRSMGKAVDPPRVHQLYQYSNSNKDRPLSPKFDFKIAEKNMVYWASNFVLGGVEAINTPSLLQLPKLNVNMAAQPVHDAYGENPSKIFAILYLQHAADRYTVFQGNIRMHHEQIAETFKDEWMHGR